MMNKGEGGEAQTHLVLTRDSSVRRQGEVACSSDAEEKEGPRIDRPHEMVVVKTPSREICFQGKDYEDEAKWMVNLEVCIVRP